MPEVSYLSFLRDLGARDFSPPPVIAVAGDEEFMRRDALSRLRERLEGLGYTWDRIDHDEASAMDVVSRLRSSSLFGERTAVVLKSARRGTRQEAVLRFKDDLLEYLAKPSKSNLLIFDGESWNGSYAVPRAVKKDYTVVECAGFKPWEAQKKSEFIEGRASFHGLRLGRGTAQRLLEACGDDLGLCDTELAKLGLVAQGEISPADLDANLRHRGADHDFELCDAILRGDTQNAFKLGKGLFLSEDPGDALRFLGLLESQVQKLAKLQWNVVEAKMREQDAAVKAGYIPRSPQISSALSTARRLSAGQIRSLFRILLDADQHLKGGGSLAPGTLIAMAAQRVAGVIAATGRA